MVINFRYLEGKKPDLRVYISQTDVQPNDEKNDGKFEWPKKFQVAGSKGPKSSIRIFKHPYLYLTLVSRAGCKVNITTQFTESGNTSFKRKPRLMTSIDTKDQNENSSENIAAAKPITSIMEDYEKGTLKLTEV